MQIALSSLPARCSPPPSASDAAAADADGFAQLLQQQAPPQRDATPAETTETTASDDRRMQRQRAARTPARGNERPAPPEADTGTAGSDPAARGADDTPAAATDAGLRDWLAALHLPAAPAEAPAAAGAPVALPDGGATTRPARLAAAGDGTAAGPDAPSDAAAAAGGPPRLTARDKPAAGLRAPAAAIDAPHAQEPAAADVRPTDAAAPRPFALELAATARPAGPTDAAPLPGGAGAADAPQPPVATTVALATPLDDPQFPRAFGVQVSVLARDGVQRAELHLNPAEMGPVSVQIVLDGTQARIDFGADAAGTRQLIEHSLPDLAAALREAGLTLTGGGVSQHSAGHEPRRDGAPATAEGTDPATPSGTADAAPVRRHVRAGGLDLYA